MHSEAGTRVLRRIAWTLKGKAENWADSAVERLFPGMQSRQVFTLYAVIPVAIGAVSVGIGLDIPLTISFLYLYLNGLPIFICCG